MPNESMSETQDALTGVDDFMGPNALDLLRLGASGMVEVPTQLQIDPEIRGGSNETGEAQRSARRNSAPAPDDLVNTLESYLDRCRQVALRHAEGEEKLLQKHLAGVRWLTVGGDANHVKSPVCSMVVGDLYFVWACISPDEADELPVVDANAVLPSSVFAQSFQPIAGGDTEIAYGRDRIQHVQLSPGHAPNRLGTSASRVSGVPAVEHVFGSRVIARDDHSDMIARRSC